MSEWRGGGEEGVKGGGSWERREGWREEGVEGREEFLRKQIKICYCLNIEKFFFILRIKSYYIKINKIN